jgi:hypothetical protein
MSTKKKDPHPPCSLCGKEKYKDVFEFSSPFIEQGAHCCQKCWQLPQIKNFQHEAWKIGKDFSIKENEDTL